jgi:hypothetical protein
MIPDLAIPPEGHDLRVMSLCQRTYDVSTGVSASLPHSTHEP